MHRQFGYLAPMFVLLAAAGCASVPPATQGDAAPQIAVPPQPSSRLLQQQRGERIAQGARAQLGAPYRYGGADPLGFDCSGLVRYVYGREGLLLPRTAAAQQQQAQPVDAAQLQPGDLLFFRSGAAAVDHVAIYVGEGLMIHAPRSGRVVEQRRVDDAWYARRFVAAGRAIPEL